MWKNKRVSYGRRCGNGTIMWITFLKRVVATIGMLAAFSTLTGGLGEFRGADTGIEVFRGLIFTVLGAGAFIFFLQDFIQKRWPFEGIGRE